MLFNSLDYIIFLPVACLVYWLVPGKVRKLVLLAINAWFYLLWGIPSAILLACVALFTYGAGILLESAEAGRKKKWVLLLTVLVILGVLAVCKFTGFMVTELNLFRVLLGMRKLSIPKVLQPVGVSFYTLTAIGYLADIYKGKTKAERNLLNYLLFSTFFATILSGPFERSTNLLPQFRQMPSLNVDKVREGLYLLVWGFFLKLMIGDRLLVFVVQAYEEPLQLGGAMIWLTLALYAVQLYADFMGYSVMAMGSACLLGFDVIDNFNVPFASRSIGEVWNRWHISLSSWLRDYVYIPLGGSRQGKWKKYRNVILTMCVSGLWHGTTWNFVFWGALQGLFQVIGMITAPWKKALRTKFSISDNNPVLRILQNIVTMILFIGPLVWFHAPGGKIGLEMNRRMLFDLRIHQLNADAILSYGLTGWDMAILAASIALLLAAEVCKYRGIVVRRKLMETPWAARCILMTGLTIFTVLYGVWGSAYSASSFVYFNF